MPHTLDQILPSLEALGLWSYWIIGLASMLEAFFVTGGCAGAHGLGAGDGAGV